MNDPTRILLVAPRQTLSFWSLSEAAPVTQRRSLMPPIALATLAALTPADVDVRVVDENVEALDFSTPCDLVGITGYVTQRQRMFEIADRFRALGVPVAIGGPYASLSPDTVRPHADVLFRGEAEQTWPRFVDDFRAGAWDDEYHQQGNVDLASSPPPRLSTLHNERYYMGAVQSSRGCPFECEFCDVIVYLGRRQRYKDPDQVVAELRDVHAAGLHLSFLSDDNLTAHRGRATDTLGAIAAWNETLERPMTLNTQLSIDVADGRDDALLGLCAEAGIKTAFVGIETPEPAALLEVKKRQNVRGDLVAGVRRLHERGIAVQAGMIVGFDVDTVATFERQFAFAQEAGTVMISLGALNAPEGTALEQRLAEQGRLRDDPVDDVFTSTNIVPLRMTDAELQSGLAWLMNRLFAPDAFLDRLATFASALPPGSARGATDRAGAELWDRLRRAYRLLGPDLEALPRRGAQLFQGKDLSHLGTALVYHVHVVRMLRQWGVWDPELAAAGAPRW